MAAIELRILGTLDLRKADGGEIHTLVAQPKRIALLTFLCLGAPRGFHRRDSILGLFWPEADQTHARTSLRNSLHMLRRSLGDDAILTRGDEEVSANFDLVRCDATAFDDLTTAEKWEEGLALYRGDLLPGFFLEDVPLFERWLDAERLRLRGGAARAARIVAERREAQQHLTEAVTWARRAVQLTDTDERAVRRLLELLTRVGDRAGALQAYEDFARHLANEYDSEPSAETRDVIDKLRTGAPAPRFESTPKTAATPSAPSANQPIAGYEIKRELGHGGTSTVFLARDLKHDRDVAIKILRPDIATLLGTDRFLAEISLVAKLHHPHILPLLDSGETGGLPFYVMPRVEGETLRSRLQRERVLSFDAAVSIVCEVADALSYANGRGIIHRDIKPENILLTGDHALLSDFGIARAISVATDRRLTQTGVAMGTVAYMSPEQADGAKELDERTDVYSLGCVLYEMLVGDPPFSGSNAQTILARKLAEPAPPLRTVRETVPPDVERVVLKALARAPADRYASVAEFVSALKAGGARQPPARRLPWRRISARKLVTAALVLVAVAMSVLALTRAVHGRGTTGTSVRRKITTSGDALMGSVSPDGQFLAYTVLAGDSQRIMVQDLVGGSLTQVTSYPMAILSVEWAPDGSQLLVGAGDRAFLVPRLGGPKRFVGPDVFTQIEPYWVGNGSLISGHCSSDRRILLFDTKSDDTTALKVDGDYTFMNEGSWSPSGKVFALMLEWANPIRYEIRAVGIDGKNAVIVSDSVVLGSPRWSADGSTLYYARGTSDLWRISVSPTTGVPRSPPERLIQDLELYPQRFGLVHFSLAAGGHAMVYARGERYSNLWLVDQTGTDTAGRPHQLTTGTTLRWSPVVSPDGKWVAFAQETDAGAELFKMPIEGGSADQVTFGARIRPENQIAWSPDGNRLAFSTVRGGHAQVWIANVGDNKVRRFEQTNVSSSSGHLTWAPGNAIAFERYDNTNIQLLDPASGKEQQLLPKAPLAVHSPVYSPDGSKLAIFGAIDGEGGAYVVSLRDRSVSKSGRGAFYPRGWSPDGRYLYLQRPQAPGIFRADSRSTAKESFLRPPFREAQCRPVGATRPNTFICVAFDFVSDIWRIDNFDRN